MKVSGQQNQDTEGHFFLLFLCLRNNISDANTLLAEKDEIFNFHYNKEQTTYVCSVFGKKPLKYSDCIMDSSFHSSHREETFKLDGQGVQHRTGGNQPALCPLCHHHMPGLCLCAWRLASRCQGLTEQPQAGRHHFQNLTQSRILRAQSILLTSGRTERRFQWCLQSPTQGREIQ